MKKKCFKCGRKLNLTEFYKHPQMKDGHVNFCKDCKRENLREIRYGKNRNLFLEKERKRRKSDRYRLGQKMYLKQYRIKFKEKYEAHKKAQQVNISKICSMCGKEKKLIYRHHPDYRFPLWVVPLCPKCHGKVHYSGG